MTTFRSTSMRTAFAALMVAFTPAVIAAQGDDLLGGMGGEGISNRPVKFSVGGGLTLPNGQLKSLNDNGFHFSAALLYKLRGLPIVLRPDFSYTQFRFRQSVVPTAGIGEKNNTRAITGAGIVELQITQGIYAFAGAGALNLKNNLARDTTARKSTGLLLDAGGGYRFAFGPILSFFELRLTSGATDEKKFGYSRLQMMPITFGFVF